MLKEYRNKRGFREVSGQQEEMGGKVGITQADESVGEKTMDAQGQTLF